MTIMDLLIRWASLLVAALFLYGAGDRVSLRITKRGAGIVALFLVLGILAYYLLLQDRLLIARLFPFSGIVV